MGERERSEISESDSSVKGELGTLLSVSDAIVQEGWVEAARAVFGVGGGGVVWGVQQRAATGRLQGPAASGTTTTCVVALNFALEALIRRCERDAGGRVARLRACGAGSRVGSAD